MIVCHCWVVSWQIFLMGLWFNLGVPIFSQVVVFCSAMAVLSCDRVQFSTVAVHSNSAGVNGRCDHINTCVVHSFHSDYSGWNKCPKCLNIPSLGQCEQAVLCCRTNEGSFVFGKILKLVLFLKCLLCMLIYACSYNLVNCAVTGVENGGLPACTEISGLGAFHSRTEFEGNLQVV